MTISRLWTMFRLTLMRTGFQRAEYLKKKDMFAHMGDNCFWQPQFFPPEPELIKLHDNVVIAARVYFITHDVIHHLLRNCHPDRHYKLQLGPIEIGSNVFIGSNTTILPGTKIENNVIIGAGSVVKGKISEGGVYSGAPLKRIGDFDALADKRELLVPETRRKTERYEDTWKEFYQKWPN